MTRDLTTLSFFDVIDQPATLMRRHLRSIYPVALVGTLVGLVPTLVQQSPWMRGMMTVPDQAAAYVVILWGMIFVLAAVSLISGLALFDATRRALDDEPISIVDCYRVALRPMAFFGMLLPAIGVFLGYLCCCLPGILLISLFAFVPAIIVHERAGPGRAMERSVDLALRASRRSLLTVLGVGMVAFLVSYSIQSIHTVPAMVIGGIIGFGQASSGEIVDPQAFEAQLAWVTTVSAIIAAFIAPVGYVYVSSAVTLLYRQCCQQRDGSFVEKDLAERIRGLHQDSPPESL